MNRKYTTLKTGVKVGMCSVAHSDIRTGDSSINDGSGIMSTFQTLAENCGFKVIREEGEDISDCHSDQSKSASVQTASSSPRRWSTEPCCGQDARCPKKAFRDLVVDSQLTDSILNSKLKEKGMTVSETHVVSTQCEKIAEPTVDYLDMSDIGDAMDSSNHNAISKIGLFAEGLSCIGSDSEQFSIRCDSQKQSCTNNTRLARYKIIKRDLSCVTSRNRNDTIKAPNMLNKISTNLQAKLSQAINESKEYPPHIFNLPFHKTNNKIFMYKSNSSRFENSACAEEVAEKSEKYNEGHQCTKAYETADHRVAGRVYGGTSGNSAPAISERTSESEPDGIQAFSNVNSSCLRQRSGQQNKILTPNSDEERGMLAYLRNLKIKSNTICRSTARKRESRGDSRDSQYKELNSCDHRSSNMPTDYRTSTPTEKDTYCHPFNKYKTVLLPSTRTTHGNKAEPEPCRHCTRHQQKMFFKRSNVCPCSSIAQSQYEGSDKENSVPSSQGQALSEVSASTAATRGGYSVSSFPNETPQHDYNINFNSDDGNDENSCSNSFIGHYLFELWKHQCLCDVQLKVGNSSFLAHKIVLAAFSDIFCPDDPQQIPTLCFDIPDITEEALCLILQYLYTSEMEITDNVLEAVYTAANILEIGEIADLVTEILSKPSVENFETYLGIRERIGLPVNIMENYKEFISENLLDIEDSLYIMKMPIDQMEKLLCDPDVKIESEEDIIRLIIKWIKFNPCQRSKHASELLALVNFECIGPEALSAIVEQNRHLFDLASMDIIMAAFKNFALKCKEMTNTVQGNIGMKKYIPSGPVQTRDEQYGNTYETEDCLSLDSFNNGAHGRSRKNNTISPQEIRKKATLNCCDRDKRCTIKNSHDISKRRKKPSGMNGNSPNAIAKNLRRRRSVCDSSNNFPLECSDQRFRSVSSESKCGHFNRRLNSSRSDSETAQQSPTYFCTKDGHFVRKRTMPARNENVSFESGEWDTPEYCSNLGPSDRTVFDDMRTFGGLNSCQVCRRSRSSPLSSASSQRYNPSSSGSSKRVTFSSNGQHIC